MPNRPATTIAEAPTAAAAITSTTASTVPPVVPVANASLAAVRGHTIAIDPGHDGGPSGRAFHVNMPALLAGFTDDIYSQSHRLGVCVRDAFVTTGMPTSTYFGTLGLVERSDLGGLNLSDVPKVLVETGNMRDATDAALLESSAFREQAARALAAGLARFLANR